MEQSVVKDEIDIHDDFVLNIDVKEELSDKVPIVTIQNVNEKINNAYPIKEEIHDDFNTVQSSEMNMEQTVVEDEIDIHHDFGWNIDVKQELNDEVPIVTIQNEKLNNAHPIKQEMHEDFTTVHISEESMVAVKTERDSSYNNDTHNINKLKDTNLNIISEVCKDKRCLLECLRLWKLVPPENDFSCDKCGGQFTLQNHNSSISGWRYICRNQVSLRKQKRKQCGHVRSFRHGTFFHNSKLTYFQILGFVNLWVENVTLKCIARQLEISLPTAVDWASFCREVLLDTFLSNPQKIGGPGKVVEIDESKFGKRKYHKGRYVEGQWVFGGYERGSGQIFMVTVEQRDTDTLLPIILQWIEKGTTIISDCWKAYNCLSQHGYQHLTVSFKDADTGRHTNSIESYWRHAKAVIMSNGQKKAHVPGNLARYLFYKHCAELGLDRTLAFCQLAGCLYDPRKGVNIPDLADLSDEEEGLDF